MTTTATVTSHFLQVGLVDNV